MAGANPYAFKHVYQFNIRFTQIKPLIWRRFQLPETETFWGLHVAIQDLLGWQNQGMHRFYARHVETKKIKRIAFLDETFGCMPFVYSWATRIAEYVNETQRFLPYACSFDNEWDFRIEVEDFLLCEKNQSYPRCLEGEGQAPPQVCKAADREPSWLSQWLPYRQYRRYRRIINHLGSAFDATVFNKEAVVFSDPMLQLKQMGIDIRAP